MPIIDGQIAVLKDEDRGVFRAAEPLVVNEKDGSVLIEVPAGEFEMGDGKDSDCPKHRVHLDRYWIGIYCVSNRQYERFVRETGHRAPNNSRWKEALNADHPVTDVSWDDGGAYAKWAGCVLATEAQWEKAARGLKGLIYPWGNEWDQKKCRNDQNKGNEQTSVVWGYGVGSSGYGTYNQSGNVWEWTADWYGDDYYGKSSEENPRGPERGSVLVPRGGCWWFGVASIFRGANRDWFVPAFRFVFLGFRLARTL